MLLPLLLGSTFQAELLSVVHLGLGKASSLSHCSQRGPRLRRTARRLPAACRACCCHLQTACSQGVSVHTRDTLGMLTPKPLEVGSPSSLTGV